ncbi:MAG: acyltransferase [Microthrixaceae bacterium]|nr:acyltransferase [Microthrixaceae bacterium]
MKLTGWLVGTTEHLWYIWTFLIFVALSGVYRWLIQRAALATMLVMGAVVVLLTVTHNNQPAVGMAYQMAWVAGMIWAERDCEVPPVSFLVATAGLGFAVAIVAVAYWLGLGSTINPVGGVQMTPSTLGIAMAGLGAAWLAVGMLLRNQLVAAMRVRGLGSFIAYLNRRLLTIYLWHLPATLVAPELVERSRAHGYLVGPVRPGGHLHPHGGSRPCCWEAWRTVPRRHRSGSRRAPNQHPEALLTR